MCEHSGLGLWTGEVRVPREGADLALSLFVDVELPVGRAVHAYISMARFASPEASVAG